MRSSFIRTTVPALSRSFTPSRFPLSDFPKAAGRNFPSPNFVPTEKKPRRLRKFLIAGGLTLGVLSAWNLQGEEEKSWQLGVMKTLPLRALSRCWGMIHSMELPKPLRAPVYNLWTVVFDCNLAEMSAPIDSYRNLKEFFIRHLKEGSRPIAEAPLVAPVDALVTVMGEVDENGRVEQIKGMSYPVSEFLGEIPLKRHSGPNSQLYYIVFYLAPGDYHRIHSSADTIFKRRQHFPGHLFPVAPSILRFVPNLFVRNERVVLAGDWQGGFFSLTPVGAYNVGSIRLNYDEDLITNKVDQKPGFYDAADPYGPNKGSYTRFYKEHKTGKEGLAVKKGDEIARFELGSTVVLIFEADKTKFVWAIQPGERSKVGQKIGEIRENNKK